MAKANAVKKAAADLSECALEDRTDAQIRAYLDAVEPVAGIDTDEPFFEGKFLIRQMAATAADSGYPELRLTRQQCADVLTFVREVEPRDSKNFDTRHRAVPNPVMGLWKILGHVVDELRRHG